MVEKLNVEYLQGEEWLKGILRSIDGNTGQIETESGEFIEVAMSKIKVARSKESAKTKEPKLIFD